MTEETPPLPCAEKVTYESKKEAAAAGLAADWQHGAILKAYQCNHCQLWHLSSN